MIVKDKFLWRRNILYYTLLHSVQYLDDSDRLTLPSLEPPSLTEQCKREMGRENEGRRAARGRVGTEPAFGAGGLKCLYSGRQCNQVTELSISQSVTLLPGELLMFYSSLAWISTFIKPLMREAKKIQTPSWWLQWAQCNLPAPSGVRGLRNSAAGSRNQLQTVFSPSLPRWADSLSFPQHVANPRGVKRETSRFRGGDEYPEGGRQEREG